MGGLEPLTSRVGGVSSSDERGNPHHRHFTAAGSLFSGGVLRLTHPEEQLGFATSKIRKPVVGSHGSELPDLTPLLQVNAAPDPVC